MILDETEADDTRILGGGEWIRERWWYRIIQVCRRWRYLVLESASHLRLSLVCARGTPVADMLAHSPPLPLIIDHFDKHHDLSAEDEEGINLALQHRYRVRRIRVTKPIPILQKFIHALDGEFPILEYLFIMYKWYLGPMNERDTNLKLSETFQAPHLRQLVLMNFAVPIESPILATMANLVNLSLISIPPSAYFPPSALLQRLSLLPQLETLGIDFNFYNPSRDVETQLLRMPNSTRVTLPNLRWLGFRGVCAYLEALLPWVTIPHLEKLQVCFFNRMVYSIPHLQQFLSAAKTFRPKNATFTFFNNFLNVTAYPYNGAKIYTMYMEFGGKHLDWQVLSAGQIFHALRTVFSAVEHLTLKYNRRNISSEWNNEAGRTQWRELLGLFGKVKTLFVDGGLVVQLSRALQPGEEESPTELLPELQELSHSATGASYNAFTLFVDARQKIGHPVTVIHP